MQQTVEAKNEAETILAAVEKARKSGALQKLTSDEIEKIEESIDYLKASMKGNEHQLIRDGIDRLDRATRRLAQVMMDDAVLNAMHGKNNRDRR